MIADGINHAIPIQKEIKSATKWLIEKDLILVNEHKYSLTTKGNIIYGFANLHTNDMLSAWKNLELQMIKMY